MVLGLCLVEKRHVYTYAGRGDDAEDPVTDTLLVVVGVKLREDNAVLRQFASELENLHAEVGVGRIWSPCHGEVAADPFAPLEDQIAALVCEDVHPSQCVDECKPGPSGG